MRGGEQMLELIASVFPTAPIYTLFHFPGKVSSAIESHPIETSFLQSAPGLAKHYRRYLPLFPSAVEDFDFSAFDLLVSSSHCVAKGAIPAPGARHICYCFTPMRYAWDQEHAYFPRRKGIVARLRNLALTRLRTWDAASAARVDHFVAISSFVAERIRRYYGREAEVLPPAADIEFFTPGEGGDGAYALAIAALVPYKRIELASRACARAGLELRVIGEGPDRARLERQAGDRTRFLGRVDRERLRHELRGAACLVQPGVEDFGIAAVEALACGTPVVALGRGGVLDIVRDGEHGILYPESGEESLAAAIDKLGQIRFNELNLRTRAEEFSTAVFVERFRSLIAREGTLEGSNA